jgi:hypothetical protein
MVVTYHWAVLYNFGQIAPTMYQRARSGPDFDAFGTPNFTEAVNYPPTNNIFYNETLFTIYSNYLTQTLVPRGREIRHCISYSPGVSPGQRSKSNPERSCIFRHLLCTCTKRQLKGWLSLLISVLVAWDYAFIKGAYALIIFVGGKFDSLKVPANSDRAVGVKDDDDASIEMKLLPNRREEYI